MSDSYLAWAKDIDYRGNSPRNKVVKRITEILYRKVPGTCVHCEMGDTPDRVPHDCARMIEMASTYEAVNDE